jgi:hypothetical protein
MPTRGRLRRVFQKGLWAQLRTSPHQQQIHLKVKDSISLKGQAQGNRHELNPAYLAPSRRASPPPPLHTHTFLVFGNPFLSWVLFSGRGWWK